MANLHRLTNGRGWKEFGMCVCKPSLKGWGIDATSSPMYQLRRRVLDRPVRAGSAARADTSELTAQVRNRLSSVLVTGIHQALDWIEFKCLQVSAATMTSTSSDLRLRPRPAETNLAAFMPCSKNSFGALSCLRESGDDDALCGYEGWAAQRPDAIEAPPREC